MQVKKKLQKHDFNLILIVITLTARGSTLDVRTWRLYMSDSRRLKWIPTLYKSKIFIMAVVP